MGARYYFDVTDGADLIRDDVGEEANSPEQALEEARAVIAEMRERDELPDGEWEMVVRDAAGTLVGRLPVR